MEEDFAVLKQREIINKCVWLLKKQRILDYTCGCASFDICRRAVKREARVDVARSRISIKRETFFVFCFSFAVSVSVLLQSS